jgi:hypothetical protein
MNSRKACTQPGGLGAHIQDHGGFHLGPEQAVVLREPSRVLEDNWPVKEEISKIRCNSGIAA